MLSTKMRGVVSHLFLEKLIRLSKDGIYLGLRVVTVQAWMQCAERPMKERQVTALRAVICLGSLSVDIENKAVTAQNWETMRLNTFGASGVIF